MTSGGHIRIVFGPAPSTSRPRSKHICTNSVAQLRRAFLGCLIVDQFDADHQPQPAHIADDAGSAAANRRSRAIRCAPTRAALSISSCSSSSMVASAAATATGLPPNVLACAPGRPVHQLGAGDGRAQRHAAGDAFGQRDHIRDRAEMLGGEHLAGASHAALDLVENQQDAVVVGHPAQLVEELLGRHDVAAFALHRLDEDGGALPPPAGSVRNSSSSMAFDAFDRAGIRGLAIGAAVAIRRKGRGGRPASSGKTPSFALLLEPVSASDPMVRP